MDFIHQHLDQAREQRCLPAVARGSGVPYRTLQKISLRETKNPRANHVDALYSYFSKQSAA